MLISSSKPSSVIALRFRSDFRVLPCPSKQLSSAKFGLWKDIWTFFSLSIYGANIIHSQYNSFDWKILRYQIMIFPYFIDLKKGSMLCMKRFWSDRGYFWNKFKFNLQSSNRSILHFICSLLTGTFQQKTNQFDLLVQKIVSLLEYYLTLSRWFSECKTEIWKENPFWVLAFRYEFLLVPRTLILNRDLSNSSLSNTRMATFHFNWCPSD